LRRLAIILIILLIINLLSGFTVAEKVTIKSISPSPYYDSQPKVWGDYIVWRRAINQNNNGYIELKEPSWIMVHNLESGETWNITPADTEMNGGVFYHAQSPDISDGKVLYEAQTGLNSSDTKLFIHNISEDKTWELPILSTEHAHGHLHCIYGNWVAYTNIQNGSRQAYLYNYQDRIYRTILGVNDDNSTYGMVMSKSNIVLTVKNESGAYGIWIYSIGSGKIETIEIEGARIMLATSTHGNKVGIISRDYNSTDWRTHMYVIGGAISDYYNSNGILLWDTQVALYDGQSIQFLQSDSDEWIPIYGKNPRLGDIYRNTVVWSDNENSEALYGDARDDYDIYVRTVITDKEILFDNLMIVAIIVAIIIGVVLLRLKLYSGNEK